MAIAYVKSEKKIVEYMVVESYGNIENMEKSVNEMLGLGWELYGDFHSIAYSGEYSSAQYFQAMVKSGSK